MLNTGSAFFIVLQLVVILLVLLFGFGLAARRLHDFNKSGWWSILTLVPFLNVILALVLIFKKGQTGENHYGEDPLAT